MLSPTLPVNSWDEAKYQVNVNKIEDTLNLNDDAKRELEKIEKLDFNIFDLRNYTQENELVTVVNYILARENIFQKLQIPYKILNNFINKI